MSISRSTGQGRHGGRGRHRNALNIDSLFAFRFNRLRRAGALEPGANCTWVRHVDSDEWLGPDIVIFNAHDGYCDVLTATGSQRIDYRSRECASWFGPRPLFACPGCHRARAILLMGPSGHIGCRTCIGANYGSTWQNPQQRAGRRAMTIRNSQIALGGVPDPEDEDNFPSRPKWQRFKVFERLAAEFEQLMTIFYHGEATDAYRTAHKFGYAKGLAPLPPKPPKMRPKAPGVWKAKQPPRLTDDERAAAEDARLARNRASLDAERKQPQASYEITKAEYAARGEPVHWSILEWAKENGLTC